MSARKLKIVLFDGNLHPPSFIRRLAEKLAANHHVAIMGFAGTPASIRGVRYLNCGSASQPVKLMLLAFGWAFKAMFLKGRWQPLSRCLKASFSKNWPALQSLSLDVSLQLFAPDIVHLQWPSLLPWMEPYKTKRNFAMVLSQRGYQINVRPFTDRENRNYLAGWYPYLDGFHSVAKAVAEKGDLLYNDEAKIDRVVYSGFKLETLPFIDQYSKKKRLKILSVGRPHWIKGYSYALEAMNGLNGKGMDFQYTIIGAEGDEELLYIRHAYGLEDKVEFTGRISQQEVYDYMKSADVLLLSSLEEGIANVVIEAMFLGLPVISTQCGGLAELISDGQSGWLVPTHDSDSLERALLHFQKLPLEELERVRLEARKKVEAQHSMERMVADMEELYQLVINN